jgi:hypothetical protein
LNHPCFAGFVTNLDFIELLLERGADPNAQDHLGMTPLMFATPVVPCAAKFLAYLGRQYYYSIWSILPGQDL